MSGLWSWLPAGQHQTVVIEHDGAAGGFHRDALLGEIDSAGLAFDKADADRIEYLGQGHAHRAKVGLIVAHPDGVPGIAVDDGDSHLIGANAEFVELARRADGAPQSGEAGADHDDVLHRRCSDRSMGPEYSPIAPANQRASGRRCP